MIKKLPLALLTALLLGACAPSMTSGAGIREVNPIESVQTAAGQNMQLAYKYPAGALELDEALLDGMLKIDFDNRSFGKDVNSVQQRITWLKIRPVDLPRNWAISLERADALRQIVDTKDDRYSTTVRYRDYVRVVYNITVPKDAEPGRHALMVKFDDGRGKGTTLPVFLTVRSTTEGNTLASK
ncbi:hypothetical protein [Deinococcus peraridilitoris]|uniref:Uncharacterized protein n=1 Tax=Deinococcus peraridilitoris (strain DSM 19664 / LMG 22246 / CIP 109416 / KR-200) TaxID=937777 RepID=L0A0J0_DEIPD|nr:hypothetical protein [Deinococcus peraridilitoris]AFZ66672.1 hypothetical protein Deipe_1110 [Deinococcus peraridilitoris DSM 19664]